MPVNLAAVRAAEARQKARQCLDEERNEYKKLKLSSVEKLKISGGGQ
jgi:hypothetical protein